MSAGPQRYTTPLRSRIYSPGGRDSNSFTDSAQHFALRVFILVFIAGLLSIGPLIVVITKCWRGGL